LEEFSGVEIIPASTVSFAVYGDACAQGGGGWNPATSEFFSLKFPSYMLSDEVPIHIKEFIVVILSVRLWASKWAGHKIIIYCDNDAVCDTCVNQKPKDPKMQKLLREFLYWVCRFNFFPVVTKIGTKENYVADFIGRNTDVSDIDNFFEMKG